jgi:hypothetical protein
LRTERERLDHAYELSSQTSEMENLPCLRYFRSTVIGDRLYFYQ